MTQTATRIELAGSASVWPRFTTIQDGVNFVGRHFSDCRGHVLNIQIDPPGPKRGSKSTADEDIEIIREALADVVPVDGEHGAILAAAIDALKRIDERLNAKV